MKWNESGFRPPLCTYSLNWARRTSWGWWDDWDDTVLQTQDSKFEPWRSEAEHDTSLSRRLPAILTFTRGWGRNIFCFFQIAETGNRTPNSGVKGCGANHYPMAPALLPNEQIIKVTKNHDNRLRIDLLDTEKLTFIFDWSSFIVWQTIRGFKMKRSMVRGKKDCWYTVMLAVNYFVRWLAGAKSNIARNCQKLLSYLGKQLVAILLFAIIWRKSDSYWKNVYFKLFIFFHLKAISRLGWAEPTLIQEKAIPLALEGKDILARARTGSGKTASYAIPLIQKILVTKQVSFF